MVKLFEKERERLVAEITEDQFRFLADHLEEEADSDRDYYLNIDTLDYLEEEGADPELMGALRRAMEGREEMEIRWVPAPQ
ncbi:galactosyldiacylglycerol synthase [bacterium]|nr:MAG: galactosyldiacylglycerol synthase [bacterium]MCC7343602.1 galactosyldiacylglycerol synthase [Deltaproteobacteria bacterium]